MSKGRPAIILDPRQMFILAEEFRRATHLLAQLHRQPGFSSDQWVPRPNIMISAMSLEIYFKCLYILDHRSTHRRLRTHNLKRLFEFLLPDTQAKLREYFDPAEGQAILDHYRQHQGRWLIGLPKTFTFDFALFASSNTFEWIR
jgi:hypothetical protein